MKLAMSTEGNRYAYLLYEREWIDLINSELGCKIGVVNPNVA
jgi:hypothetical protein